MDWGQVSVVIPDDQGVPDVRHPGVLSPGPPSYVGSPLRCSCFAPGKEAVWFLEGKCRHHHSGREEVPLGIYASPELPEFIKRFVLVRVKSWCMSWFTVPELKILQRDPKPRQELTCMVHYKMPATQCHALWMSYKFFCPSQGHNNNRFP